MTLSFGLDVSGCDTFVVDESVLCNDTSHCVPLLNIRTEQPSEKCLLTVCWCFADYPMQVICVIVWLKL